MVIFWRGQILGILITGKKKQTKRQTKAGIGLKQRTRKWMVGMVGKPEIRGCAGHRSPIVFLYVLFPLLKRYFYVIGYHSYYDLADWDILWHWVYKLKLSIAPMWGEGEKHTAEGVKLEHEIRGLEMNLRNQMPGPVSLLPAGWRVCAFINWIVSRYLSICNTPDTGEKCNQIPFPCT